MVLKRGFTLVEILIVMAIILVMAVIIIGIINPINLSDRGYDARRKNDIKRIGVAFEEYFNDKGCYPKTSDFDFDNMTCGGNGFAPWISSWICDPRGENYKIVTDTDNECPKWYRVFTKLGNNSDKDIPPILFSSVVPIYIEDVQLGKGSYNFGVSSTNVDWYDRVVDKSCEYSEYNHAVDNCFNRPPDDPSRCGRSFVSGDQQGCAGVNCYARSDCNDICNVPCCGAGCN